MNNNSGALQSIAAIVSVVLTVITIGVLYVTWQAIGVQAKEARALTDAAKEQIGVLNIQTRAFTDQASAASAVSKATERANELAEESNRLLQAQLLSDLRPILVYAFMDGPGGHHTITAIRNVGCGAAIDVKMSIGLPKDDAPGTYLPFRSVIGAGDEVAKSFDTKFLRETGVTLRYASLDGRRFSTALYMRDDSVKHDFAEYSPDKVLIGGR